MKELKSRVTGKESVPLQPEDDKLPKGSLDDTVTIEQDKPVKLYYKVTDSVPIHLNILFSIQQALLPVASCLSVSLLVSELTCAGDDTEIQAQILGTAFMMTGMSTLLMTTVGCRLPIFQGPSSSYIIPLLGLSNLKEWSCPSDLDLENYYANSTVLNVTDVVGRLPVPRHIIYTQLSKLQGSLMVAGVIHFMIGFTGLVGVVANYVGPITIVPALLLALYYLPRISLKFAGTYWGAAIATTACGIVLSLYLRSKKTPIPCWKKGRGFYILWYPLHQVFAILISVIFGWILSVIFTYAGLLSTDPNSKQFYARTDARNEILVSNPWFFFPYPGQFSSPRFDTAAFIGAMVATIMSVVDSICDYNACARMCYVPFPPGHALNRGIFWEGLMSFMAGACGAGHATSSYGGNIGAIGITKVASRRVFQGLALIYILFAILGLGSLAKSYWVTIPYSVLGGTMILYYGIFVGIVLSQLQFVDLNSTRNLAILGISMLVGFMVPHWIEKTPDGFNTGVKELDNTLKMLGSNGIFVAGMVACFLDNTVAGSRKIRGLDTQLGGADTVKEKLDIIEGLEVYDFPWLPNWFKQSFFVRWSPMFPNYSKENEEILKENGDTKAK